MEYTNYIQNGGMELSQIFGGGKTFEKLSCPMGLCMNIQSIPKPKTHFRINEEREPRVINMKFLDKLMDEAGTQIEPHMQTKKTTLNFTQKSNKKASLSKQTKNKTSKRKTM